MTKDKEETKDTTPETTTTTTTSTATTTADKSEKAQKSEKSEKSEKPVEPKSETPTRRKRHRIAVTPRTKAEEKSVFQRGGSTKRQRSTTNNNDTKSASASSKKNEKKEVIVDRKWQDWKEIYLVGTEWYAYDGVYDIEWDFDHLRKQLAIHDDYLDESEDESEDEDGEKAQDGEKSEKNGGADKSEKKKSNVGEKLDLEGKNVFVFGSTEPQMFQGKLRHIPVLIVVVGTITPPCKIGINSVQMEQEEILDMKDMKMSWVPYVPRSQQSKVLSLRNQTNIYFLHCKQRRSALKRMKDMDVRRYEYALPYFIRPSTYLNDVDEGTEVNFVYAPDGKRAMNLSFDWEMDDREEWLQETCENNDLDVEKDKEALMAELRSQVLAAKKAIADRKKERQETLDAIPDEEKKALDEMKFYKFYPMKPDVSEFKSSYINRYYGHATKTFP